MKKAESVEAEVKRAVTQRWCHALILAVVAGVVVLTVPPASGFPTYDIDFTNPRTTATTTGVIGIIPACTSGQTAELRAIVLQESSGALAEGEWLGSCTPNFQNYEVETKTVAGSPELQDGLASVFLFGVTRDGSQITSVSEATGRSLTIRSASQSGIPNLTVTNTTDASRNPGFRVGDSWRLDLTLASPNAPVFLQVVKDSANLGVFGPSPDLTDAQGRWSLSGSFGPSDVAFWGAQAVIGSPDSSERSTAVLLRVD